MKENRKTYRIRTAVGNEAPATISVNLNQTFDTVDVLSLEINQKNFYKMPSAGYGVVVGRVIANGGFGIPNAKVSVFIPYDRNSLVEQEGFLYHYTSTQSKGSDGIRYNLLPRTVDEACHQDIGSMYEKEYLLDNKDIIQVFDKYYKYTAVTNSSGDYFIYGVPVGTQTLHVDLDLSDIGPLSQRPRDMIYKGYSLDMFENPNKFKKDKNLNSLAQVYTQDNVVNIYPFWGDTTQDSTNGVITRCDVNIDYTFEPTCVFIGSIVSDTGSRAISQRCVPDDEMGKMSDLVTGEGKIEMIRKTFDGKVEEFAIKGNNLIDGDGVWCYQIPMNLDYVVTDEFGNVVPTDDPSKGIPTRTRVRFRISMNETETDDIARKRARFLVPNNPKLTEDYPDFNKTHEADYEFGTFTKEENYRDLFWNKVYTVKSYIPRLQKAKALRRRVHTGIKNVNHAGNNNPFPFNNLFIRLTFVYRFLCMLISLFCGTIYILNTILSSLAIVVFYLGKFFARLGEINDDCSPICWLFDLILLGLPSLFDLMGYIFLSTSEKMVVKLPNFCDDGNFEQAVYTPGAIDAWINLMRKFTDGTYEPIVIQNSSLSWLMGDLTYTFPVNPKQNYDSDLSRLLNCVENQLAQDQECTSFNFNNDWVNGVLYAPLWFRKVKNKKSFLFGLITIKAKDIWCSGKSDKFAKRLSLCQTCAQKRKISDNKIEPLAYENMKTRFLSTPEGATKEETCYGYKCHKKAVSFINVKNGLIMPVETMLGETVYYYKSVEYDKEELRNPEGEGMGDIKTLFATDIVLLGSLNNCDNEGVPAFFNRLEGTTYNMPPDLVQLDYESDSEKLEFLETPKDESFLKAFFRMNIGDFGMSDIEDEIDESEAINLSTVHTDKSGSDWGNYGKDQVIETYNENGDDYILTTKKKPYPEFPDVGGLFYGITCWSAYTKPKSCVNLSRICEFGVSLDESQENPIYQESNSSNEINYQNMPPDGFVSYDELYDMDGRAMFATMNGNNLKTVVNPNNGFPIYDFKYLYQDNFDGSLYNIMRPNPNPYNAPLNGNYKAELSSDAYLRFRYGRNYDNHSIDFYNSITPLGMYRKYGEEAMVNKNRFPKYENSFYFYFGLKPGNTAIDKFRTLYYSECRDTEGELASIDIQIQPNTWCSEMAVNGDFMPGDGYLKVDATNINTPYNIDIVNIDGNPEYDIWCHGISESKIYMSYYGDIDDIGEGFVHKTFYRYYNGIEEEYGLMNGNYRLTIIDANGDKYVRDLVFMPPTISASVSRTPFRMSNNELASYIPGTPGYEDVEEDLYVATASLGGFDNETMANRSDIGGFIEVKNIQQDGDRNIDFSVDVVPLFMLPPTNYVGSHIELAQDEQASWGINITKPDDDYTLINENFDDIPPYCPYGYDFPTYPDEQTPPNIEYKTNGGNYDFRFGVPVGGKRYRVTVTMLCKNALGNFMPSRNSFSTTITVPEPILFEMTVNNIDYSVIRNFGIGVEDTGTNTIKFGTGWVLNNLAFPDNYMAGQTSDIVGWNDMDNIDGLQLLNPVPNIEPLPTGYNWNDYIRETEEKLTNTYQNSTTPYTWNQTLSFDPEIVQQTIGRYTTIPESRQNGCNIIYVLVEGDYVCYIWNSSNNEYVPYEREDEPGVPVHRATTQDYYDNCDIEGKNEYISQLNSVTQSRIDYVSLAKDAFLVRTPITDDMSYNVEVGHRTSEKPVKTLIYYTPDGTDEFVALDDEMNETTCYGMMIPTIGGALMNENNEFIWDGQDLKTLGELQFIKSTNDKYKRPYLVAIQNALNETRPKEIGLNNLDITLPIDSNNNIAPYLFGVHIMDKRLRFVYNTWAPIVNAPYFKEGDTTTPVPAPINIPGLFAGFVLDGVPQTETLNPNTYPTTTFMNQVVGNEEFKLTTFTVDNDFEVNESALPVVRFINSETEDTANFSDYVYSDTDFDSALGSSLNMKKHICFSDNNARVRVKDAYGEAVLPLYGEVLPPIVEYSNINGGKYNVSATFENGWCYTFYDGASNPIYSKTPSQCLTFQQGYGMQQSVGRMYFNDTNFNFNINSQYSDSSISIDSNIFTKYNKPIGGKRPITLVYAVKISEDKQRRVVSKTYDLTLMECCFSGDGNNVYLSLNVNVDNNYGFYYLKNYTFLIECENEDEGISIRVETVNGYVIQQLQNYYATRILLKQFDSSIDADDFLTQLNNGNTYVYITDVTGLRRKVNIVSVINDFQQYTYNA